MANIILSACCSAVVEQMYTGTKNIQGT
jgi:hypothetical protein